MTELVDWLTAQLDEDERIALDVQKHMINRHYNHVVTLDIYELGEDVTTTRHLKVYVPEGALADIAAKRKIVELHRPTTYTNRELGIVNRAVCLLCHSVMDCPADECPDDCDWPYPLVQNPYPCYTVRLLASAYAHRDGYREEWKVGDV